MPSFLTACEVPLEGSSSRSAALTRNDRMAEIGISPHTILLVLNHVSARKGTITGAVYVQYSYDREKREALDAWGARLLRIISGRRTAVPHALVDAEHLLPST